MVINELDTGGIGIMDSSAVSSDENVTVANGDEPDELDEHAANEATVVVRDRLDERASDEFSDEQSSSEDEKDEKKHERRLAQPKLHSIELMRETAIKRGGKCLSTVYKGLNEKLEWQCCDEHIWEATPRNILHCNSWCPKCRGNVGEELVRATLIEAFGKPFERTRREEWLRGRELDGYNSEMKLAFEYQGIQHFQRVPHFHREDGQFELQLARDAQKREDCKNAGVTLLEISHKVKFEDLRSVVRKMLIDLKFSIADAILTDTEFYNLSRAGSYSDTRLELAKTIAIAKGGVCLATKYISFGFKMPFKCREGHEFRASLQDISQPLSRGPRFCPTCGGTQQKSEDEIRARVEALGYQLSAVKTEASGGRPRRVLTVRCPANHDPYDVIMDNLISKDGSLRKGCSKCSHAEHGRSLRSDISTWLTENGIEIIGEYTRNSALSRWKCSQGHEFEATFVALKQRKNKCRICLLNGSA
jgi:hypothetical protein